MRRLAYNPSPVVPNPSTGTWVAIVAGILVAGGLVGYGIYRFRQVPDAGANAGQGAQDGLEGEGTPGAWAMQLIPLPPAADNRWLVYVTRPGGAVQPLGPFVGVAIARGAAAQYVASQGGWLA